MKQITKISAIALASLAFMNAAHAATPGSYLGLGLGWTRLATSDVLVGDSTTRDTGGLGGRVFGGYAINQYFGIETGYSRYAHSLYKASGNDEGISFNDSLEYKLTAIDVVGKVSFPLAETGFNVYALAGLARVHQDIIVKSTDNADNSQMRVTASTYRIRPVYGIGTSYDINSNVTAGLELTRIQGVGNLQTSSKAIPHATMATFNISYHFG